MANYTYQVALAQTEAGMVNVLSSTSSFFTLTLAAIFPSGQTDKFTLSKLLAVLLSICGIVSIITLSNRILLLYLPLIQRRTYTLNVVLDNI